MTRSDVERLAGAFPPGERKRVWLLCGPHDLSKLPKTEDGYLYCQHCLTLWSGNQLLNIPRDQNEG
jgi:hypothetical protein